MSQVTAKLGRSTVSILLVDFLPTLLINMINQVFTFNLTNSYQPSSSTWSTRNTRLNLEQFWLNSCVDSSFPLNSGYNLHHQHGELVPRVGDHRQRHLHDGPHLHLPLHLCKVNHFLICSFPEFVSGSILLLKAVRPLRPSRPLRSGCSSTLPTPSLSSWSTSCCRWTNKRFRLLNLISESERGRKEADDQTYSSSACQTSSGSKNPGWPRRWGQGWWGRRE